MACEEPELLTDICGFTTQFYVILGQKFSELLESSIESDLSIQLQYGALTYPFAILLPSNKLFLM